MRSIQTGIFRKASALVLLPLLAALSLTAHAQEGSATAGRTKAATCAACHGQDGNSAVSAYPSLAGQHVAYIVRQLEAYQSGDRENVIMSPLAMGLSAEDMRDIAAWYASQTVLPKGADPEFVGLGEDIYRGGVPERNVAACIACHGPGGNGNAPAGYPKINSQHAAYIQTTLHEYASGARRSDAEVNQMMRNVAEHLTDAEIQALASYIQGLR